MILVLIGLLFRLGNIVFGVGFFVVVIGVVVIGIVGVWVLVLCSRWFRVCS